MADILPLITNRKLYPYYGGSNNDFLQIKFSIKSKNRTLRESGIKAELWLNHQGSWVNYSTKYTNRYGVIEFNYSCAGMSTISNCLAKVITTYNGKRYNSNIVRLNFITSISFVYDIDAGSCTATLTDRSSFDVFDAQNRPSANDLTIDRMLY